MKKINSSTPIFVNIKSNEKLVKHHQKHDPMLKDVTRIFIMYNI